MTRLITLKPSCCLCVCLFFVVSINAQVPLQKAPFDFDGNNKTDLTVYRPTASTWHIFQSQSQLTRSEPFGVSTDRIVPGDFDGDGKCVGLITESLS